MSRYLVTFTRVDTFSVEVEADSHSDAVGEALETDAYQNAPGLCAYCSGWSGGGEVRPVVDTGEWDVDEQRVYCLDDGGAS